jgi:hypothetical protein
MEEERKVYQVLMAKPEGMRRLGRLSCIWEDGIKMDCREICWEVVDCIHLALDGDWYLAVVNTVINLQVLAPQS